MKKLYLGMLAMVLAFGMLVVGCDDDPANDNTGGNTCRNNTSVNSTVGTFERTVTQGSIIFRDDVTFSGGPLSGSVSGTFHNRTSGGYNPSNGTWSRPNANATIINISWSGGSSLPSMFSIQGNNIQSGGVAFPMFSTESRFIQC